MSLIGRLFPEAVIPSSRPDYWSIQIEFSNARKKRPGYTPKPLPLVEWDRDPGHKTQWGGSRMHHPRFAIRVGPVRLHLSWRAVDGACVDEWSGEHIGCDHKGGTRYQEPSP